MKKVHIADPVVKELDYNRAALEQFQHTVAQSERLNQLLLEYPTVYIVNSAKNKSSYEVYVGETNDIGRRTIQHLNDDAKVREDWQRLRHANHAKMFVIGHEHFNKSLTLDIENRLMMYLTSVDKVSFADNRRDNPQNQYYTKDELDQIFPRIWGKLHERNRELFPAEQIIKDSAIFKASPFHTLRNEQLLAKDSILERINAALGHTQAHQLIFVEGEAGSGKTVLLSNLFYEIAHNQRADGQQISCKLIINHDQQLKVYQEIANKLGLDTNDHDIVSKATHFINTTDPAQPVDVALVDEAHLLWTQGKQSYRGHNQLRDIMARARVTIIIFDTHQILTTEEYWENKEITALEKQASDNHNLIILRNQLRMEASQVTINWLRNLVYDKQVGTLTLGADHRDTKGYEVRLFDSPAALHEAIMAHADPHETQQSGLSRMLATFDWPYKNKTAPKDGQYWNVRIGEWQMPWNLQRRVPNRRYSKLAWAEQPQTINEVGSTYTIQGFDLNYSGVIIGPSVKYRHGHIVFDKDASENKKATQQRSLKNGHKVQVAEQLLQNELNVLLTRGVHGLYLYAVDPELQAHLRNAIQSR